MGMPNARSIFVLTDAATRDNWWLIRWQRTPRARLFGLARTGSSIHLVLTPSHDIRQYMSYKIGRCWYALNRTNTNPHASQHKRPKLNVRQRHMRIGQDQMHAPLIVGPRQTLTAKPSTASAANSSTLPIKASLATTRNMSIRFRLALKVYYCLRRAIKGQDRTFSAPQSFMCRFCRRRRAEGRHHRDPRFSSATSARYSAA